MPRPRLLLILLFCGLAAAADDQLPPAAGRKIDFSKDVEPLLRTRCQGCHGARQQMSGLRLDAREGALHGGYSGPVIKPGNSADSTLVHRISGTTKNAMAMPPAGNKLSPEEIVIIRSWIDQGADWPASTNPAPVQLSSNPRLSHWSFQPVRRPAEPTTTNTGWARNPVDTFILSRLERDKIAPSPEADKRTLLRRLSLDLIGLPPTPEETTAFLADKSGDAYERQVDRLLASPHFGERWARPWLDRARYADSDGYEKDWARPYAWRYRQWVIEALNRNQSFDQFTIDQIAGDLEPNATVEQRVAVGFHRNTLTNREGGVDNNQFRFENTVDRANTVGSVWMGLTVGCAQCHDHKFDPTSQKDFYQMFALFDNLEEVDIDAPMPGELGPYLKGQRDYKSQREKLITEYHVAELQAAWEKEMLDASANPGKRTDWDLAWDCLLKLTEGGDGERIIRIPETQRTPRQREVLRIHFIRNYHFAVGPKRYAEVKFKELDQKLTELKTKYPQLTQAMTVEELSSPQPSFLRVRGNYKTNGIPVQPGPPSFLPAVAIKPEAKVTRLDFAKWLVSPDNPLTSRVAVNWMWQELFGQGLVKTADDFGLRGDKPSHPELLDWLASEFQEQHWNTKAILRTMVTSATYRQSSKARPELDATDPANALLARQSRLRLPAELIRDSALAVSGLLSPEIGGPSIKPVQPAGVAELGYGKKDSSGWVPSEGRARYRRGLYIFFQRSTPYPELVNFDAPKTNVAACTRERSNTPLQALNLLNDPVFLEAAQSLAFETVSTPAPDLPGRLQYAFQRTLNRAPSGKELQSFQNYFARQQSIFENEPDSVKHLATADAGGASPVEMATWVAVSSVLLNLDEFITRE